MAQANAPVKTADAPKAPKVKKEKKVKQELPAELAVDAQGKSIRNAEGKYTGVPVKWTRQYKSIKEKDFAEEATFIEFKAHLLGQAIEADQKRHKNMLTEAANIRKIGGNEKVKKTVRKVQKMRNALEEMLKALKDEGISV